MTLSEYLAEYAADTVREWMRLVWIDAGGLPDHPAELQARCRWHENGTFTLSETGYGEEYGRFRLTVNVEPVEVPPTGPEDDGALRAELADIQARRYCGECLDPNEDPAPWCECGVGETCIGPCKHRAHQPGMCPERTLEPAAGHDEGKVWASVWVASTMLHIEPGDLIRIPGSADLAEVLNMRRGLWHAGVRSVLMKSGKWWDEITKWEHFEVRADLSVNGGLATGLTQYPSDTPVEILCTPERAAQLVLAQAFIGTTEAKP